MTSKSGKWGKRGTTGLAAGSVVPDFSQGFSGTPAYQERERKPSKIIHIYHVYHMIMSAVKRIPVAETVWKELSEMRSAGQTYTELLEEMMEARKKDRLVSDMKRIEEEGKFVSLSEIKD
jgi:predicted CopG family antitoxin